MKITVVITTYQRYELVIRAIKSVLAQTYKPDKVFVIEDASDSGIRSWIEQNHIEVSYIQNSVNLGLAGSRNIGIQESETEWIAFLDDDDEWLPQRLEMQVEAHANMKKEDKEMLACIQCGVLRYNEDHDIVGVQLPINDGYLKESIMLHGESTPSSSFLFSRNSLIHIGGFDNQLISGIDHDIWMKLAAAGYKTKAVRKPLTIVHQETKETMMTDTEKRIIGITQYVMKWTPTYIEWFGKEIGETYAIKYYTKVICRLAGHKLSNHQYTDFFMAYKSIWNFTNHNPLLLLSITPKIIKIYCVERFPAIKSYVQRNKRVITI